MFRVPIPHSAPRKVHASLLRVMLESMFRRAAAALALAGLITSPVVASTRLFCRYTGAEIVGCTEQHAPDHAVVRGEACCVRQTVQPLDTAQPASTDRFAGPAVAVLPEPAPLPARSIRPVAFATPTAAAGPPAFLSHRALLI